MFDLGCPRTVVGGELGKMLSVNRDYELQTHRAEDRHWWYRGRRHVLERTIERLGMPPRARILDAGCGSGRNMVELARRGEVTGVEISPTSAELARARHVGEVVEGSVMEMPFAPDSFDLAVCLDVVEHLPDDRGALRELRRVLAPGGALLVTVPAYQWLWSGHDKINQHCRRYSRTTLERPPTRPAGSASTPPTSTHCCYRSRSRCARSTDCTAARPNRVSTCGCRRRR